MFIGSDDGFFSRLVVYDMDRGCGYLIQDELTEAHVGYECGSGPGAAV